MSSFKPGEIVDITIKGARVEWANSTDMNVWAVDEVDPDTGVNLGEQITISHAAENVTIERVAPAEWPPRPGDLWRDGEGDVWFAVEDRDGDVHFRATGDTYAPTDWAAKHYAPLTLVHREDEQDGGTR